MFMEAAMDWDADKLTAAISVDPLVQDFRKTRQIAKEILDYNAQFLPKGWI
jgi:alpha-galactosidase/6-phospho-beta-glucosidase family protein